MQPKTLFVRTSITIAAAMLITLVFIGAVLLYYILAPVARQASSDLAALVVLSAQTWVELPPDTRSDFEYELESQHGLTITPDPVTLQPITSKSPYIQFLEEALSQRLQQTIHVMMKPAQDNWLWIKVPMASYQLHIGFSHDRIGARPPLALLMLIIGTSIIALLTSLLLARRLTLPLERLATATSSFGQGKIPDKLSEEGPRELALLAYNFNRMTEQVQRLINNRTILLGGISHDLRTPIARLRLALEFIDNKNEPELLADMLVDLEQMDHLIGRTLELAKGMTLTEKDKCPTDLIQLISTLVLEYQTPKHVIQWQNQPSSIHTISPIALRRVVGNLLENALRYGNNKPVEIQLIHLPEAIEIHILDSGAGIPSDQIKAVFLPFYRLEGSRNLDTGGSGLGLAIVQQLCELQGWKISMAPRNEGGTDAKLWINTG